MCQVTESYSDPTLTNEINEMPLWLRPTGGFGIGLQSVFAISDTIDIDTQSEDGMHLSMKIESPHKKSGIVRVEIEDKPRLNGRGTTIKIRLKGKAKEEFDFSTFQISVTSYAEQMYGKIREFFQGNCRSPLFPITARWKEMSCTPEGMSFYALFKGELSNYDESKFFKGTSSDDDKRDRYYYRLSKEGTQIEIWDTKTAWLAHWELSHIRLLQEHPVYFFKGMHVDENTIPWQCANFYANCRIDACGLDTNQGLQLNRSKLTASGITAFLNAIAETGNLYMEVLREKVSLALKTSTDTPGLLERHDSALSKTLLNNESDGCYRLAFWLSVESNVREKLSEHYSGWFKDIGVVTYCLEMCPDGYTIQNMPVEDYIKNYATLPRLISRYVGAAFDTAAYVRKISSAFQQMKSPYSQCKRILIADIPLPSKNFRSNYTIQNLPELVEKTIAVCGILSEYSLTVSFPATTPLQSNTNLLHVNPISRKMVMFAKPNSWSNAKRCYLPILLGYQSLALDRQRELKNLSPVSCEFDFPDNKIVISPVTSDDDDAMEKMSREDFQKYLKATEPFQALLKYVAEHIEMQQSSETITGLYLQLAGEIWDARHQKAETENETSDNAENVEASETVPDADALPKQEGESPS